MDHTTCSRPEYTYNILIVYHRSQLDGSNKKELGFFNIEGLTHPLTSTILIYLVQFEQSKTAAGDTGKNHYQAKINYLRLLSP